MFHPPPPPQIQCSQIGSYYRSSCGLFWVWSPIGSKLFQFEINNNEKLSRYLMTICPHSMPNQWCYVGKEHFKTKCIYIWIMIVAMKSFLQFSIIFDPLVQSTVHDIQHSQDISFQPAHNIHFFPTRFTSFDVKCYKSSKFTSAKKR